VKVIITKEVNADELTCSLIVRCNEMQSKRMQLDPTDDCPLCSV